eukprot:6180061-Pleurochrysis_carterae.AAC.4
MCFAYITSSFAELFNRLFKSTITASSTWASSTTTVELAIPNVHLSRRQCIHQQGMRVAVIFAQPPVLKSRISQLLAVMCVGTCVQCTPRLIGHSLPQNRMEI